MLQNGSEKKKKLASLKHVTYKIEEKSISTITNMKRGKKNLFALVELMVGLPKMRSSPGMNGLTFYRLNTLNCNSGIYASPMNTEMATNVLSFSESPNGKGDKKKSC